MAVGGRRLQETWILSLFLSLLSLLCCDEEDDDEGTDGDDDDDDGTLTAAEVNNSSGGCHQPKAGAGRAAMMTGPRSCVNSLTSAVNHMPRSLA